MKTEYDGINEINFIFGLTIYIFMMAILSYENTANNNEQSIHMGSNTHNYTAIDCNANG